MTCNRDYEPPEHPLVAAVYDPATWIAERAIFPPHREYLARGLDGRVLDLGAGTGAMIPYFARAADEGHDLTVYAVEPDPHMRTRARERARQYDLDVEIHAAVAESLPYEDASFDAVVGSMVFCTIPDVDAAISEVTRVLEPGGEFRFLEHVAADGWRLRLQRVLAPLWRRVAGGCHLTRRTPSALLRESSLEVIELERLQIGVTPVRPFVRGRMVRRVVSQRFPEVDRP